MSSIDSSINHWHAIAPAQLIEIGLVHVEIQYDERLLADCSEQDVACIKEFVRNSFRTVAELRGGKHFPGAGEACAYMFLIRDNESFDNCALAAVQILEMAPALNQDIQATMNLAQPIRVRIACDAGMVRYNPGPGHEPEDFVKALLQHEPSVAVDGRVVITDRIYRQLTRQQKAQFVHWDYSAELEIDLYATPPLQGPDARRREPPAGQTAPPEASVLGAARQHVSPNAVADIVRRGLRQLRRWPIAGVLVAIVFIAAYLAVRAVLAPPPPASAMHDWKERVHNTPEWYGWRKHVHEKLSGGRASEASLAEALRLKLPAMRNAPALALRHDQAMADVLLSYDGVADILRDRLGIDERFLGTGLSNPVNAPDYGAASVHEYLLPNLPDSDPRVLTLTFKDFAFDLETKIKEMVEKHRPTGDASLKLKKIVVDRAESRQRGSAVIRFARLNMAIYEKSKRLGRPERVRVFASDLPEVWDLSINEAANRSGYTFTQGDTFFVWIFAPHNPEEAVLATWGHVLDHLPAWLAEANAK